MYDPKPTVLGTKIGAAGGIATLPHTGAFGIAWYIVAGFTLVMAGIALLQLVPRKTA
jgi:LPXTG-motif cell wall-anchored protein